VTEDELSNSLASWVPPWQRVTAAKPDPAKPDPEPETDKDDETDDEQRPETDTYAEPVADDRRAPAGPPDDDDDEQRPETDLVDGAGSRDACAAAAPDDEQRPETDVLDGESREAHAWAGPDDDEDDEQRPETDVLDGEESRDVRAETGPDDDDDDEQRPETDVLDGESREAHAWAGPDDDEDDEQRPETDVVDGEERREAHAWAGPDDDEDEEQRPETDVVGEPSGGDEDDEQRPETDRVAGQPDGDPRPEADRLARSGGDDERRPEMDVATRVPHHAHATDGRLSTIIGGDDEDDFDYLESRFASHDDDEKAHHAATDRADAHHATHTGFADRVAAAPGEQAMPGEQTAPSRSSGLIDEAAQPLPVEILSDRPENLAAALEAILLVVDEPVSDDQLAEVVDVPVAEVTDALMALAAGYAEQGRGFDLRRAAGGWRFYTRGEYSSYVERFVLDGQSVRLTQAALETLAVIAYQQPVTRSRMSAIRGVSCDGVVRTLMTRGLIEECGTQPDSGAFLYRTTPLFLEKLGLDSLDELPPLAPFLPDDVNGFADV
jgi:segregation and condensation protein B